MGGLPAFDKPGLPGNDCYAHLREQSLASTYVDLPRLRSVINDARILLKVFLGWQEVFTTLVNRRTILKFLVFATQILRII